MGGYPGFSANQEIPKVQAIVALANGLNLTSGSASILSVPTTQMPECSQPTPVDDVAATQCCRQPSECESTQSANASDPCGSGGTFVSSLGRLTGATHC